MWIEVGTMPLRYYPEEGVFKWTEHLNRSTWPGMVAGGFDRAGYRRITYNRRKISAHRLAWMCYYKKYPDGEIDHINGDKDDNRISNLRLVNASTNCKNKKKYSNNSSGHTGVRFHKKNGKWISEINSKYIGSFDTIEEAVKARENHPDFKLFTTRHGK